VSSLLVQAMGFADKGITRKFGGFITDTVLDSVDTYDRVEGIFIPVDYRSNALLILKGKAMMKMYSPRDIGRLFGFTRGRIRYWEKIGFLTPSITIGARKYYTSQDLVAFRTAKGLLDARISFQEIRRTVIDAKGIASVWKDIRSPLLASGNGKTGIADSMIVRFRPHAYFPIGSFNGDFKRGIQRFALSTGFRAQVRGRQAGTRKTHVNTSIG
jgi:hypothetical protein